MTMIEEDGLLTPRHEEIAPLRTELVRLRAENEQLEAKFKKHDATPMIADVLDELGRVRAENERLRRLLQMSGYQSETIEALAAAPAPSREG
jgi:hypothetical protein